MSDSPFEPPGGPGGARAAQELFATMSRAELRELIRNTARRLSWVRAERAGLEAVQPYERTEEQEAELDLVQRTDEAWTAVLRAALAGRRRG